MFLWCLLSSKQTPHGGVLLGLWGGFTIPHASQYLKNRQKSKDLENRSSFDHGCKKKKLLVSEYSGFDVIEGRCSFHSGGANLRWASPISRVVWPALLRQSTLDDP